MAGKLNSPIDHLFRAGQISAKQHGKLSAVPKDGKMKSKMAKFEDKRRDEASVHPSNMGERSVASNRHIDQKQDLGTPARGSGKPSKRGFVQNDGSPTPLIDEIDRGKNQKPLFPKSAGMKGSNKTTTLKGQPSRKVPKSTGDWYSGGRHQDGQ